MESIGTINVNVQKKFFRFGIRKIKLHYRIYLLVSKKGPRRHMMKSLQGNKL
jgi:hypothetical protein